MERNLRVIEAFSVLKWTENASIIVKFLFWVISGFFMKCEGSSSDGRNVLVVCGSGLRGAPGYARMTLGYERLALGYARLALGYARVASVMSGWRCVMRG
ncbi:hypothetical protein HNO89_003047 [Sporosarcina luteola]|nr:hypothetical protein [Sporosarcina luteola]